LHRNVTICQGFGEFHSECDYIDQLTFDEFHNNYRYGIQLIDC